MKNFVIFLISFFFTLNCSRSQDQINVAFYNLENLFDTLNTVYPDTSMSDDPEFYLGGKKEWTKERLDKKMYNLSKIIRLINNGNAPDIMGFAESENKPVFSEMINKYLEDRNYEIVYFESKDRRGIDVTMIFKKDKFQLLNSKAISINGISNTRDILYSALLIDKDTLHLFVNHWPSRRGGEDVSSFLRGSAAQTLLTAVNTIYNLNQDAKIVIMGDFNDMPENKSIKDVLKAMPIGDCNYLSSENYLLFNTSFNKYLSGEGTYYYQGQWNMLDQLIISKGLLSKDGLSYKCNSFDIIKNDLNMSRSGKYQGAPFPTYAGTRYLGGYSDHFPVNIFLEFK